MKLLSFKTVIAVFILVFSIIYSLPTFYNQAPDWLNSVNAKKMNLGLDLKGGVHFLMEVDLDEVVTTKSKKLSNDIRSQLRNEKIRYRNYSYQKTNIEIQFANQESFEEAAELISKNYQDTFDLISLSDNKMK